MNTQAHPAPDGGAVATADPASGPARRGEAVAVSLSQLDAVLFDLDGVLTDTASVHEAAWTAVFTELFDHIDTSSGKPPAAFTGRDYRRLVDGRPRLDGVRDVLADRGLFLPVGSPADPPGQNTAWAVAADKDERFASRLTAQGALPFPGAVRLLQQLHAAGIAIAVVSASRHCADVLSGAGLDSFVDVRIDGQVAAAMGLAGKPDPASYLEAAHRLGVDPDRAAVVEDALAGVMAGRRGRFHLVVGVDRRGHGDDVAAAGADLVVADLTELQPTGPGPLTDGWHLTYRPASQAGEGVRETLGTLSNGYFATRGAATWASDDSVHYPGSYLAGIYNRLVSDAHGQSVERESIVNAPNWLPLTFGAGDGFLGEAGVSVTGDELQLDLRSGVLRRRYRVTDLAGRRTTVTERRLVSMAEPHLAAIQLDLVAENWSGALLVRSAIDGSGCADQTAEAQLLAHCHLTFAGSGQDTPDVLWLAARTTQSDILIAEAARTRISNAAGQVQLHTSDRRVSHQHSVRLGEGARCRVEKVVAIYHSRDRAISEPTTAARQAAAAAPGFTELLTAHRAAWAQLWSNAAVEIVAAKPVSGLIRLQLFHLLAVASPHVIDLDVGLGARGLHGEGYEGHVFWDEMFIFPVLNLRFPDIARSLLSYRQRRLPAARRLARAAGEAGARFPWQSGSDGSELTPTKLFNSRTGRWMPDRSANQRHVGLAVAFQTWQHYQTTGDDQFLINGGGDVIFEVARHFAHLATFDEALGRWRIRGVMGPDEFHDGYPWTSDAGIDDNAYTNVLASWLLSKAGNLADTIVCHGRDDILRRLSIDQAELTLFKEVSEGLHVPSHDGVISQFAGYEQLEPIDLDDYRARYRNIGRLDLILDAEGDTVRRYQVAKQADTLMLFYLFPLTELREIFLRLGYRLDDDCVRRTIDYYSARVTHGSTLSKVVHAWVTARADRRTSWHHLNEALAADMADTQGGTTREGIHLAAMASTVDLLQRCYTGLETRGDNLVLDPLLPDELTSLHLNLVHRGHRLNIHVNHSEIVVASATCTAAAITVLLAGQQMTLRPGGRLHRQLSHVTAHKPVLPAVKPLDLANRRDFNDSATINITEEHPMSSVTDPVCGMTIEQSAAAGSTTHGGTTYYFCSSSCQERFEADPQQYAPETP